MADHSLLDRAQAAVVRWQLRARLASLQGSMKADPTKAILLFASPRGGSTWLEQVLATIPRTATIWEPLFARMNPEFAKVGFWWRQHIPEAERWPEAEAFFQDLFSGRILSPYLAQSTTPEALAQADRLIVKFVRGNLLLPWLVERFELPKPVLLVRHPCAVVASMLHHGGWRKLGGQLPPMEPHRHDGYLRHMIEQLGPLEDETGMLTAIWCLNNAYPLQHPGNDRDWTTITYEELVLRTEDTLSKVFNAWNMPIPTQALDMARSPSRTTRSGSPVNDPEAILSGWRNKLSSDQQERILAIVKRAGVDLYDRDLMPHRSFTP
jgi:hypothetical protein